MSFTLRRVAGSVALTVAASALTLPFAAPASAITAGERVWTVLDSDGDDAYGLFHSDGAGATLTKVEESATTSIASLSASADGTRVIYLRYTFLPATEDVKQEVVVRDTSTRQVRVLETKLASTGVYPDVPGLSPDGTKAVWESYSDATELSSVRKALVGSGASSQLVGSDLSPYAFLSNDTVLVQTPEGTPYTIPFAGGTATTVTGLPEEAINVTVSPDGSTLAWAKLKTLTAPFTSDLQIAPVSLNSGIASVGAPTTLDTTTYNRQPAFSRDGSKVFYLKTSGASGASGDLWSVPVAGGAATQYSTAADDVDVAVTKLPSADVTAPASATALPAVLNGTTPTLRWTLPADTDGDLSGVIVSRTGKTVFVPAPLTSYVDSGLTVGGTYAYTFTAVDRFGNQASGVTRNLRAIKPAAYFGNPTSQYSTKASFPVRFATGGSGSTLYSVKYLPYGGTLKTWVDAAAGATRTFGVAGNGTTVAGTTAVVGGTYTFYVKAQDEYGNSSAYVTSTKAVVPWDQTKATFSGGTNRTSSAAYRGTFRRLTSNTQYARVTLVGNRLQVIGWKCASCGSFAIYQGNTKIATVSTYSSTLRPRLVLFTKTYTSSATRTFTIRPLGTAGHPVVALDGFAMRR